MTLEKQLARFSQECTRVDADRWRLALANGRMLTVTARRDEDFLLLDADTGAALPAGRLVPFVERAREFPAAVKFALRGSNVLRLRAEFPLPEEEETDACAERIRQNLEGLRTGSHVIHDWVSCEAADEGAVCPKPQGDAQAVPGSLPGGLMDAVNKAGWLCHERPGGTLLAELETGPQFLQAEIGHCGGRARFRVTLYAGEALEVAAQQALCLYLLEANAALRHARAFFEREAEAVSAGFEVLMESAPLAAEAGHALAALSVAARQCGREMCIFNNGALAGIYRSARLIFFDKSKHKGA
jgi:hypothetical protein